MALKTSIKLKEVQLALISPDGSVGKNWISMGAGILEGSVGFEGSDATMTVIRSMLGKGLETDKVKGDYNIAFSLADLNADKIAMLTGGTVTTTADYVLYTPPANENDVIELSVKFITEKRIELIVPRVAIDAFPVFKDQGIHEYMTKGVALTPEDNVSRMFYQYELNATQASANLITAFSFEEQTGAATIGDGTVAIEVANGTALTALIPTISTSIGSIILPNAGLEQDFSSPFEYEVEAADGTKKTWTVTVTVAA